MKKINRIRDNLIFITIIAASFIAILFFLTNDSHAEANRGLIRVKNKAGTGVSNYQLYKKSYALIIGASNYRNGWPPLSGVKTDVRLVSSLLKKHGFQVTKLDDPNSKQLAQAFENLLHSDVNQIENRILIYFAGHGHTINIGNDEKMGYIVPVDAPIPSKNIDKFKSMSLSMKKIDVFAKLARSKHILFVFDSCFSGSIFTIPRSVSPFITYKATEPVRQFITSGSEDEQVPDESIFRKFFLLGLSGQADMNRDGYVTGTEIGYFLQMEVINKSYSSQHPQFGKLKDRKFSKGDFIFVLDNPGVIDIYDTETSLSSIHSGGKPKIRLFSNVSNTTLYVNEKFCGRGGPEGLLIELDEGNKKNKIVIKAVANGYFPQKKLITMPMKGETRDINMYLRPRPTKDVNTNIEEAIPRLSR